MMYAGPRYGNCIIVPNAGAKESTGGANFWKLFVDFHSIKPSNVFTQDEYLRMYYLFRLILYTTLPANIPNG